MATELRPPPYAGFAPAGDEHLRIAGLTGVDIDLAIAGPGSRSYAFLIDWHIRVLLALGWFMTSGLLVRLASPAPLRGRLFLLLSLVPALLLYLLYQPVMELAMHGRTPGKCKAGVRLVTRRGGTPSVAALLIRNVFRIIDSLPTMYLVGLICCFVTRQRVRIGDLAAGTLLVSEPRSKEAAVPAVTAAVGDQSLPLALIELAQELLERWSSLSASTRRELAAQLLGRAGQRDASTLGDEELLLRVRALLPSG
jgi:uncharacterized RDD family membrane protein YckC